MHLNQFDTICIALRSGSPCEWVRQIVIGIGYVMENGDLPNPYRFIYNFVVM